MQIWTRPAANGRPRNLFRQLPLHSTATLVGRTVHVTQPFRSIETRSLPHAHSFATLATLPSMSLIPQLHCRLTIRETGIVFDETKLSQEQEENHESSADRALRK